MMRAIHQVWERRGVRVAVVMGVFLGALVYSFFVRAPNQFPAGQLIFIEEGSSVTEVARTLEEKRVVSSSGMFGILARLSGGVRSGAYSFEQRLTVFSVWRRIVEGKTGAPLIRVTIPEGATTRDMALLFEEMIPHFDVEHFREIARPKEGYLFPDTYIVAPGVSEEALVELMEKTFFEKIVEIQPEIDAFGRPLEEVVVMASLLEKEARRFETRQIVAGILWKRIAIGMPLQVDAVFGYILDTDTFNPTFATLDINSPYNTYKNLGLPPGAIANPGLDALRAAATPVETPYLYYLTGKDGRMHYGRTFDEHVANRRFLR